MILPEVFGWFKRWWNCGRASLRLAFINEYKVFSVDGKDVFFIESPEPFSLQKKEDLRAAWRDIFGDSEYAPKVFVLDEGAKISMMEFTPTVPNDVSFDLVLKDMIRAGEPFTSHVHTREEIERLHAEVAAETPQPTDTEQAATPLETLSSIALFFRRHLERRISVPVTDEKGHTVNRYAAVQIPDWEMRQRLDDIDASIAAAKGEKRGIPTSTETKS